MNDSEKPSSENASAKPLDPRADLMFHPDTSKTAPTPGVTTPEGATAPDPVSSQ